MPSIATVAYSQCNPSTIGGAALAFGTRKCAPRSTVLLAVVAGIKGGNMALGCIHVVEWKRNVMAQAQKPDSVFQRNGRVHLYRRWCQFSRVLAFLECGSAENDYINTVWTVPSQAEDCWLPTPFVSFPFTSPVRRRVPPDSVSTLHTSGRRVVSLPLGAVSTPKYLSHKYVRVCILV